MKHAKPQDSVMKTEIRDIGNSAGIIIPAEILKYHDWKVGDTINLVSEEKKYGKVTSLYNHKQQLEEYEKQNTR